MPRPPLHPLIKKLQLFLDRYQVIHGKALVAVSGGPDSSALLDALYSLAASRKFSIQVGHLNHRLRGTESDADAAFVEQFCAQRAIPCIIDQILPTQLQPGQPHLESQARKLRYQWLEQTATKEDCCWIMTGHTQNDQAETVLHHLLRGTGWRGLRGIAPRRSLTKSIRLLRPLLEVSRAEVEAYLLLNGITASQDRSNLDSKHTRNRLRHQVFPILRTTVNPHAERHLAALAQQARKVYSRIVRKAKAALNQAQPIALDEKLGVIHQGPLVKLHDDLLQELLLKCWFTFGLPTQAMTRARWNEVMEVCRGTRPQVQLPGGVIVRRKLDVIQFLSGK